MQPNWPSWKTPFTASDLLSALDVLPDVLGVPVLVVRLGGAIAAPVISIGIDPATNRH